MNLSKEIKIIVIAYCSIIVMAAFGIIRIYYPQLPFVFNISDGLWVFAGVILLMIIPIRIKFLNKIKISFRGKYVVTGSNILKLFLVSIPYIGVIIDELMQKYLSFYPEPQNEFASHFWSGTFDPLDVFFYTIGYVLALVIYYGIVTNKIDFEVSKVIKDGIKALIYIILAMIILVIQTIILHVNTLGLQYEYFANCMWLLAGLLLLMAIPFKRKIKNTSVILCYGIIIYQVLGKNYESNVEVNKIIVYTFSLLIATTLDLVINFIYNYFINKKENKKKIGEKNENC